MPLLRPPDPQVPKRKLYVRSEEPLAVTLDRYAEFLGTTCIDHIVNQALEFVFQKDGNFKEWIAQNPPPVPPLTLGQKKRPRSGLNSTPARPGPHGSELQEARRL